MLLFISTMAEDPWRGSEELWTRAATLLAKRGTSVAASVHGWPQLDRRMIALSGSGVELRPRPFKSSLFARGRRYLSGQTKMVFDIERSFGRSSPSLVIISNGFAFPPVEVAEMCIAKRWPFAILTTSNRSSLSGDGVAARLRGVLSQARRCFFISEANRVLAAKQVGYDFDNAEVVRNPIIVETDSPIKWPVYNIGQELRMACVGRLYPTQKGQDILLDVLATPLWRERSWRLTIYGNGPNRNVLERLVGRLKLQDRVSFAGDVGIEKIWRENHVLVMPSRYEGGPMTGVEAMWCGRPVVGTNVGINPEIIKDGVTGFLAEAAVPACFGRALERMWGQRGRLREIGRVAAVRIRQIMPDDPVGIFANKLKSLASL